MVATGDMINYQIREFKERNSDEYLIFSLA